MRARAARAQRARSAREARAKRARQQMAHVTQQELEAPECGGIWGNVAALSGFASPMYLRGLLKLCVSNIPKLDIFEFRGQFRTSIILVRVRIGHSDLHQSIRNA